MFKNYFKTAVRSLLRHRFFSAINIFGLAIAMSISMVIIMLVADQLRSDRFNSKRDRIYRVVTEQVDANGVADGSQKNATASLPIRDELLENYPGIEKAVRIKRGFGNHWLELEHHNVNIPLAGFYADPEVFELFEYEFQYGDPASALKEPYSVVLTRKAANKLFKEENPVGQTIKVGGAGTYTVTGVLKETSEKSHIVFEALASISTIKSRETPENYQREMESWTDFWNGWTYLLLAPDKSPADIQVHLDKIYDQHIAVIKDPDTYKMRYSLQAMSEITPGPLMNNEIGPILPWIFVYTLSGLAFIILLTSCFNFTNLSIARSLTRAREIGVRKVTGAARWQIFIQFLLESVVVAVVALFIAVVIVFLIEPLILQLNFAQIFRWNLESNVLVYSLFFVFAVVVGTLAGFFPAVVLSGFNPVSVLKGLSNVKLFSRMGLRRVLLVSQFTLSLFFILSAIILNNQLNLFVSKEYGFNMNHNISLTLNNTSAQLLKTELLRYNNIQHVSGASHIPSAGISNSRSFKKDATEKDWTSLGYFAVDEDYVKNMELTLISGKFFTPEQHATNKNYVVINEEAVKKFQYASAIDAVGQQLIMQHDSLPVTILGVVKNYNHRDLTQHISPLALMYDTAQFSVLQIQYSGTFENASASIDKAWAAVNPGLKVDYKEVDSEIKKFYNMVFGDMVRILGVIAGLAIMISCLGLLGMATYTTETRIKEISIRKILGSDSTSLILLLSRSFLSMLGISVLIGAPAAYFINNLWLELIAYHTTIDFAVMMTGVSCLLLFGAITVGSQTVRAIFINPVDNLKNE